MNSLVSTEMIPTKASGKIVVIAFDNSTTKNALSIDVADRFSEIISDLNSRDDIRCGILTGKNDLFSSGGDFAMLESMIGKEPDLSVQFMLNFYKKFLAIRDLSFPVIAAVNGHAIGAAMTIALCCDIRFFDVAGKYALNFVKLGLHPGMGTTYFLREIAAINSTQDLLFTGKMISGQEAYQRGLCHGTLKKELIVEHALRTAQQIAANGPLAIRLLKQGLYTNKNLEQTLEYEAQCQSQNFLSQDYQEAINAVSEKRAPHFENK